jgi:hypothetical protein
MKLNLIKWRLMLTTLPITFLMLLVKMGLVEGLGFEGLVKFSDIGLVVTGGIFLIGFMLAGVMSDYKESEKLPAEMACALETIEDTLILAHGFKPNFDLNALRKQLQEVTGTVVDYLQQRVSEVEVFQKISSITQIAREVEIAGIGPIISRMSGEQNNLRKVFTRITVIRRTNFLSTGYALLEVLSGVIFMLLLISRFESHLVGGIIVCFITQIFVYMIRLIRDIDQPFEYAPNGAAHAADVDIFPLLEYQRRSLERVV